MGKRKVIEAPKPKKKIDRGTAFMAVLIVCMVLAAAGIIAYDKMDTFSKLDYDDYIKLGKYEKLTGQQEKVSVTEKDVKAEIDSRLEENAKTKTVKSGKVEDGDTVIIDYKGTIDGKAFEGGTAEKQELEIGSKTMIDGFEDALIGKETGRKCTIDVTFPKDYSANELAGKDAQFEIMIRSRKVSELPKYDMDFISSVSKCKSKKDYEKSVKEDLTKERKQAAKESFENELWQKVLDKTKVKKYPKGMLKEEIELQKVQYEQMARNYGMDPSQLGMDEAAYKNMAKESLKEKLAYHAIAKKEHIKVRKADREDFRKEFLEDAGMSEKQFRKAAGMTVEEYIKANSLGGEILKQKVLEYIADHCVRGK